MSTSTKTPVTAEIVMPGLKRGSYEIRSYRRTSKSFQATYLPNPQENSDHAPLTILQCYDSVVIKKGENETALPGVGQIIRNTTRAETEITIVWGGNTNFQRFRSSGGSQFIEVDHILHSKYQEQAESFPLKRITYKISSNNKIEVMKLSNRFGINIARFVRVDGEVFQEGTVYLTAPYFLHTQIEIFDKLPISSSEMSILKFEQET